MIVKFDLTFSHQTASKEVKSSVLIVALVYWVFLVTDYVLTMYFCFGMKFHLAGLRLKHGPVVDVTRDVITLGKTRNLYYYTLDSLWKIWLVESIQSIHNSLWTWHDKCNICCRYCIYHVKFDVCLVTKPLGVFSETKWLNAWLLLRVEDTADVQQ